MSESKVFMLPDSGTNSLDPNLLMALNQNGGFGANGNWMWIFFLFFLWPLMRGNGFGFGNNIDGFGPLQSQLNNDAGRELLMQAINRNGAAIDNLAQMFGCKVDTICQAINSVMSQIQSVGNQVGMSGMQIINAVQAGNTQLGQQIAQCCCDNRLAICQQTNTLQNAINSVAVGQEKGFSSIAFETQKQTCDIQNTIKDATSQILAGQQAAEMREMQNKIDTLRELNSQKDVIINNGQQTAMFNQMIQQATVPIVNAVNNLQGDVNGIKCKLPETVTLPANNNVAVPISGIQLGFPYAGFSGWNGICSNSLWG